MLFSGTAWFSRAVDASIRDTWVKHGGAVVKQDFYAADLFFCDGPHDPALKNRLIVRHARWISKSVAEQFAVPVSKYLLDDQFDPTKFEPLTTSERRVPSKAGSRKPLTPIRAPAPREERLLVPPAKPQNALKRPLDSENRDESSIELDSRPLKRARTQPFLSPAPRSQIASPTLIGAPIPLFPTRAGLTKEFYPSPANSSPGPSPPPQPDPRARKPSPRAEKPRHRIASTALKPGPIPATALPRIDFTALNPIPAVPVPSSSHLRPATAPRSNMNAHADTPQHPLESTAYSLRPPRPSIAAVLRAPRADACLFEVTETYREKVFACVHILSP
ncbi:hypothetical protein C8R46DRAFT_1256010 [Mycena filopes]|nr:hypothetical protein C8R46DRAFT_1256010 [Mycena filopes]